MKLETVLLSLLLTGCVKGQILSPTHHYEVFVDPRFNRAQHDMVIDAVHEWQTSTNDTVTFSFTDKPVSSQPIIVILPASQTWLKQHFKPKTPIGEAMLRGVDTNIFLATDMSNRNFYETSLHELGHALGLEHDDRLEHMLLTVMTSHCGDSSDHLTCLDMRAFCREWNCDASKFNLCK